jgi:hypothetical protein
MDKQKTSTKLYKTTLFFADTFHPAVSLRIVRTMPSQKRLKKVLLCANDSTQNNSRPSTWLANMLPKLAEQQIATEVLLQYGDSSGPRTAL